MYLETYTGNFVNVDLNDLNRMSRQELVAHLESRGTACFDNETTEELRQCAIEDLESELEDSDFTASPYDLSHCRR